MLTNLAMHINLKNFYGMEVRLWVGKLLSYAEELAKVDGVGEAKELSVKLVGMFSLNVAQQLATDCFKEGTRALLMCVWHIF